LEVLASFFWAKFYIMVTKKLNKIGNFHLKGTFENNLFLNEKGAKLWKPQN